MGASPTFKLTELCELAEVTPRTVHYYVQQGLLPPASSAGPKASYDERHLLRLQLIRRLQREHLPLAVIRERLAGLPDDAVERLLQQPAASREPGNAPALDYIRAVLEGRDSTGSSSSRDEMLAKLAAAARQINTPVPWDRSQWDRIAITADVELHVRRPLSREQNRQVERLIDEAKRIFKEG